MIYCAYFTVDVIFACFGSQGFVFGYGLKNRELVGIDAIDREIYLGTMTWA